MSDDEDVLALALSRCQALQAENVKLNQTLNVLRALDDDEISRLVQQQQELHKQVAALKQENLQLRHAPCVSCAELQALVSGMQQDWARLEAQHLETVKEVQREIEQLRLAPCTPCAELQAVAAGLRQDKALLEGRVKDLEATASAAKAAAEAAQLEATSLRERLAKEVNDGAAAREQLRKEAEDAAAKARRDAQRGAAASKEAEAAALAKAAALAQQLVEAGQQLADANARRQALVVEAASAEGELRRQLGELQPQLASLQKEHNRVVEMRDHLMGVVDAANTERAAQVAALQEELRRAREAERVACEERDELRRKQQRWIESIKKKQQLKAVKGGSNTPQDGSPLRGWDADPVCGPLEQHQQEHRHQQPQQERVPPASSGRKHDWGPEQPQQQQQQQQQGGAGGARDPKAVATAGGPALPPQQQPAPAAPMDPLPAATAEATFAQTGPQAPLVSSSSGPTSESGLVFGFTGQSHQPPRRKPAAQLRAPYRTGETISPKDLVCATSGLAARPEDRPAAPPAWVSDPSTAGNGRPLPGLAFGDRRADSQGPGQQEVAAPSFARGHDDGAAATHSGRDAAADSACAPASEPPPRTMQPDEPLPLSMPPPAWGVASAPPQRKPPAIHVSVIPTPQAAMQPPPQQPAYPAPSGQHPQYGPRFGVPWDPASGSGEPTKPSFAPIPLMQHATTAAGAPFTSLVVLPAPVRVQQQQPSPHWFQNSAMQASPSHGAEPQLPPALQIVPPSGSQRVSPPPPRAPMFAPPVAPQQAQQTYGGQAADQQQQQHVPQQPAQPAQPPWRQAPTIVIKEVAPYEFPVGRAPPPPTGAYPPGLAPSSSRPPPYFEASAAPAHQQQQQQQQDWFYSHPAHGGYSYNGQQEQNVAWPPQPHHQQQQPHQQPALQQQQDAYAPAPERAGRGGVGHAAQDSRQDPERDAYRRGGDGGDGGRKASRMGRWDQEREGDDRTLGYDEERDRQRRRVDREGNGRGDDGRRSGDDGRRGGDDGRRGGDDGRRGGDDGRRGGSGGSGGSSRRGGREDDREEEGELRGGKSEGESPGQGQRRDRPPTRDSRGLSYRRRDPGHDPRPVVDYADIL